MSLPPRKIYCPEVSPQGSIISNLKQELMLSSCLINSLSSRQMRGTCSYCMFVFGMSDTSRCDCTAIFFNC